MNLTAFQTDLHTHTAFRPDKFGTLHQPRRRLVQRDHKEPAHLFHYKSLCVKQWQHRSTRFRFQSISTPGQECDMSAKHSLLTALSGVEDKGIFGLKAKDRRRLDELIRALERENLVEDPTNHLETVAGRWKLMYTTITVRGNKRTTLGLGDLVMLGDFLQDIDPISHVAENKIVFNVLGRLHGSFQITATFEAQGPKRVTIKYRNSKLVPDKLAELFRENYELLLSIFNPEGWLDITYVDDHLRVGRDDKDNVFVLERCTEAEACEVV